MKTRLKISTALILVLMFLLLSLASGLLAACGGGKAASAPKDAGQSGTGTERETETTISDNLPERDFGGYAFRLYLQENMYKDMYTDEETGDLLEDAVYYRNRTVEERFGVKIEPVLYPTDFAPVGENNILAGDDAFDIMLCHQRVAFMYVNKKLVVDFAEYLPYVDLEAPWWNQDANLECSVFNKIFCTGGDITYLVLGNTFCMLFNKTLFTAYNIEYPYESVTKGTWTMDKCFDIVKGGLLDLNGDAAITPEDDQYGFEMGNEWGYPTAVFYGGGDKVVKKGGDGTPVIAVYNERTADIFNKFFDMMAGGAGVVDGVANRGNPKGAPIFKNGRALFADSTMNGVISMRDMEDDIGVLPLPKYSESQKGYKALVEAHGRMVSVPITAGDCERTSIITEALCAESYKQIIPVYFETALKTKYARDDESAEMFDYIKSSGVFDYGYMNYTLTEPLASVGASMVRMAQPNLASFYEKNAAKAQGNIDKLIAQYEAGEW